MEAIVQNGKQYEVFYHAGLYKICRFFQKGEGLVYGVLDSNNEIVLPFEYRSLVMRNGVCIAQQREMYGVFNDSFGIIIPFQYKFIRQLGEYLLVIEEDGGNALFSNDGKQLLPFIYETIEITPIEDGIVIVTKANGKYGAFDMHFQQILPCEYDSIECLSKYGDKDKLLKWLKVSKDNYYGLTTKSGEIILPCQYEKLYADRQSILFSRYNHFGNMNVETEVVIAPTDMTLEEAMVRVKVWMIQPKGSNMVFDKKQPILGDYYLQYHDAVSFYERFNSVKSRHPFIEWLIYSLLLLAILVFSIVISPFGLIAGIAVIVAFITDERTSRKMKKEDSQKETILFGRYFIDLAKWAYDWEREHSNKKNITSLEKAMNALPFDRKGASRPS